VCSLTKHVAVANVPSSQPLATAAVTPVVTTSPRGPGRGRVVAPR
jgi:hypothetical protein